MANQESTAINDLIQLVQGGGRVARAEDPVPELFVPAIRMAPQPPVSGEIPSRQQRAAAGTPAPYVVPQGPHAPHAPPHTIAQGTPAPAYRVPLVEQHVHAYQIPHEPPVPHVVPQGPHHAFSPALPAIAQGTPAPAYHVPLHGDHGDPSVAHHVARHVEPPAQPAPAYRTPLYIEHDEEETELWQGTPRPEYPAQHATPVAHAPVAQVPHALPMQQAKPVSHPYIPTRPDLTKLPHELAPAVRYGALGVLALVAISIGAYLGASSGAPTDPANDPDRAVAIMSGELPATTHVTAPIAAPRSAPVAPKVEPIEEPIEEPEPEPVAEEAEAPVASDETEIEMDPVVKQPTRRRAARTSRIAPRTRAVKVVKTSTIKRTTKHDEIEALLAEKPSKKTRKTRKSERADQDDLAVTEVRAPKGAAVVKGTGRVTIKSNRPATIYIDGRSTGRSAPAALVIPAGDHQITLLDPSTMKAKTATIKLEADKIVAIHRDFN